MRKIVSFVGVGLVALSLSVATVYGGPKGRDHHGHRGGPGGGHMLLSPFLLKKLALTAEQEQQIEQIRQSRRPAFEKLKEELRTLQTQIGDKFFALGAVTSEDFAPQLEKAAQLRQQWAAEGFAATLEIRNVLTPEQLAKAKELKDKMHTLRQKMRDLHKSDQKESK